MLPPTFGQWVKQRRKALDLTQDELAQEVSCSLVLIQKLEAGERRPSKQTAELLAERLAVPLDERTDFVRYARAHPRPQPGDQPAPWRALRRQFTNLPNETTPLFGREQAVETIKQHLSRQRARLLTLVGPPGIGKTRLGVAAAAQLADGYDDGVFFVPLAAIHDPERVAPAIARALRLTDRAGQPPPELVADFLADKRLLLVLDNLEQVLAVAPQVAEWLGACPWLQILATSRAPLHIRAERQFFVPPLALPPVTPAGNLADWLRCPAVALFADRAQAAQPDFALTAENVGAVADICARLDGLPLAIELAAARAGQMPLATLLGQLNHRLALLTGGPRDLPARHRTLRDAIGWSYERLEPGEQRLFARLAVFVGGCSLEAAARVCGEGTPMATADRLARLVDSSLVQRRLPERGEPPNPGGQPRLAMLATVREYGLERLEASGEAETVRERHAAFLLDLAENADPLQRAWLERLEAEHDNFHAALRWLLDRADAERALRLSGALWRFWQLHGHLAEGLGWLDAALHLAGSSAPLLNPQRARALLGVGWLLRDLGDFVHAKQFFDQSLALYEQTADQAGLAYARYSVGCAQFLVGDVGQGIQGIEQSLALYRVLDDKPGIALALLMLGRIAVAQGRFAQAGTNLAECLNVEQALGETFGIAHVLGSLGELALYEGDHGRAEGYLTESQALLTELGERQLSTWVLTKRGELAWRQGALAQARRFLEDSLTLAQDMGYRWNEAYTLTYLGLATLAEGDTDHAQQLCEASAALFQELGSDGDVAQTRKDLARVALAQGDCARAMQLYQACLDVFEHRGYQPDRVECLEGLATAQAAQGDSTRAVQLLAAAQAWRERLGAPLAPVLCRDRDRTIHVLRTQLGAVTFQNAWSEGRSTPWEPLVDSASQLHN